MLNKKITWVIHPSITKAQCAAWLADLRSGKFPPCTAKTRPNDYCFCVMGVLTRQILGIAEPSVPQYAWNVLGEIKGHGSVGRYLAHNNDAGTPFPVMADWIEKHILPVCQ